jgi:hypothetical protein
MSVEWCSCDKQLDLVVGPLCRPCQLHAIDAFIWDCIQFVKITIQDAEKQNRILRIKRSEMQQLKKLNNLIKDPQLRKI